MFLRVAHTAIRVLGAAALCVACKKEDAEPAPPPVANITAPADHLAPNELIEGKVGAFGLFLPRDVTLQGNVAGLVIASGDVTPEALANYFRARVKEGTVTVGATETVFEHVRVPAEPNRELGIRVSPGRGWKATVQIRDTTPPKLPELPTEADRWKAAGLTPDGKILDPKNLK